MTNGFPLPANRLKPLLCNTTGCCATPTCSLIVDGAHRPRRPRRRAVAVQFLRRKPFIGWSSLGIAFGFMYAIERTRESNGWGIVPSCSVYLLHGPHALPHPAGCPGIFNGGSLIAMAAGGTGALFVALSRLPRSASGTSAGWAISFAGVILQCCWPGSPISGSSCRPCISPSRWRRWAFSPPMSSRHQSHRAGGETNYISATLAVYLDIYNIFVSLLNLLMAWRANGTGPPLPEKRRLRPFCVTFSLEGDGFGVGRVGNILTAPAARNQ